MQSASAPVRRREEERLAVSGSAVVLGSGARPSLSFTGTMEAAT